MSATADGEAARAPTITDDRTWIRASLGRDLSGLLVWTLVGGLILYVALVGAIFGVAGLWTYVLVIPGTMAFVALVDLFTVLPAFTARRVGAGRNGLSIIRFRSVEGYPWSGVKPGFRPPRMWPFIGHRYPLSLSGGPNVQLSGVGLTRAQAELVATHFGKTVEETWLPRKLVNRRE
jgi:hypothetical protein